MVSTSAAASNKSVCFRPVLKGCRGQGGSCEPLESLAQSWTSGWLSFPATTGNPTGSTACPMDSSDHAPLRLPTCFNWNQNTPSETKVGIVYDLLFLTQKHWTRFKNTKYKKKLTNKQTNLFGYSVDNIKGHGQGPLLPQSSFITSLVPKVPCGPPRRGSLNKVGS